jgi:hypothetical protein
MEEMENYDAAKKWFAGKVAETGKPYTDSTRSNFLFFLERWCFLTLKNPDELASADMSTARDQIAVGLQKLGFKLHEIYAQISNLNMFFAYNGRHVGVDKFEGIRLSIKGPMLRESASVRM